MFKSNLDKKGWLKIVEAFIGIIMITGVILTMMSQPAVTDVSTQQETVKLEKFIIDRIVADPVVREQILNNDVSGVNDVLELSVPAGLSHVARVCNYNEVCALGMSVPYDVYTQEAIVSSTVKYYDPRYVKVLKLFFWQGPWPVDTCPSFCDEGTTEMKCINGSVLGNYTCIKNSSNCLYSNLTSKQTCASGKICQEGACGTPAVIPCSDECSVLGAKVCSSNIAFKTCGQFDADTCRDLSPTATSCPVNQFCEFGTGNCVPAFANVQVDLSTIPFYRWYDTALSTNANRTNYTVILRETNNVQIVLNKAWRCWNKPSYYCEVPSVLSAATNTILPGGTLTKTSYVSSTYAGQVATIYYNGTDINSNKKTINFTISFPY